MKKLIFISLMLLLACTLHAQVKTIRGQLIHYDRILRDTYFTVENRLINGKTDKNGYFVVKNVTDDDNIIPINYYSPQPISIKSVTIEVLSEREEPIASALLRSRTDTLGVGTISDNSYWMHTNGLTNISKIKKITEKHYRILPPKSKTIYVGSKVLLNSFVGFSTVGNMHQLQSEYTQGQGGQWQGADKNEIFSWGPKINTLEFDGTTYPYDKNGGLVSVGSGNGMSAKAYNPKDFFRTGFTYGNKLDIKFPLFGDNVTTIGLGQKRNDSPIPNAHSEVYNASISIDKIRIGRTRNKAGVLYKNAFGRLTQQGANLATLMHSIYTTPPTFDNANGLNRKQAVKSSDPYAFQRSYAPNFTSNPYRIINRLPDREKSDHLIAYVNSRYEYEKLEVTAMLNFDKQRDRHYNGIMQFPSNHDSYKRLDASSMMGTAKGIYEFRLRNYYQSLKVVAEYGFRRTENELLRDDSYIFQGNNGINRMDKKMSRNAHDVQYGAIYTDTGHNLSITAMNKHYFSNTLKSSDYMNLFPEIGVSWNINEFVQNLFDHRNSQFRIYGSAKRSIAESSLIYDNPAILSTGLKAEDFRSYYEHTDILSHKGLKPETYIKSEIGIDYGSSFANNSVNIDAGLFYYDTHDFIAPNMAANTLNPTLQNIGKLRNYGYHISTNYYKYCSRQLSVSARLNFSQIRNKVSSVYGNKDYVTLAGFSDISSVFAKDEALGAIYGTTYLRNQEGRVIVGADGFPLVDNTMRKIGDPTPDFSMSFMPHLKWRKLDLQFVFEYSHGGDRWNGTQAFLDYHGMSENTALNRNVSGYVFDGVNMNGKTNTKAVDFYNPNRSLNENRWVRYGAAGVGEEYIEDASFFRCSNLSLSYNIFNNGYGRYKRNVRIEANVQNLFTITSYKGADPASNLFGYSSGMGLDLFNQPSTRSYSLTLTLEL